MLSTKILKFNVSPPDVRKTTASVKRFVGSHQRVDAAQSAFYEFVPVASWKILDLAKATRSEL